MEIQIDKQDIQEIENNYEKISKFLVNNFCSFPACYFILQSIENAVNDAKEQMNKEV
jgi:uncharacterized protein YutD